ncbi:prefoldin 5 isoform X1 [Calliopsis andreniformis]|uniref:prefoldin 5 isoform X1 n=1 Tax=Calliopsis andreniformis TaxID=337506 RepID=UPI003FCD8685
MAEISTLLHQVDLTTLNLQKLTMLKQELDQELNIFHDSMQKLLIARNRFQESGQCLDQISPGSTHYTDNEILVPLTGCMYVVGKLADTNNVLVDIGTGYYAQKSLPDAKDYFTRRMNYVKEQMDKIQQLVLDRNRIRNAVVVEIETRTKLQNQVQKVK